MKVQRNPSQGRQDLNEMKMDPDPLASPEAVTHKSDILLKHERVLVFVGYTVPGSF
jgi:hypothetical protein